METRNVKTAACQSPNVPEFKFDDEYCTRQRLERLLAINAETLRKNQMYADERERYEAELMRKPISLETAFSYFGALLGTLPPATIILIFLTEIDEARPSKLWFFAILLIANATSSVVGYFSGKLIAKIVRNLEKVPWVNMILLLPFVGVLWGIMAGGAGGAVIFLIGAIVGAMLGGIVGGFALPVFVVFHRLLKKGEFIELKHFLPLAFGITLIVCSFLLGLK